MSEASSTPLSKDVGGLDTQILNQIRSILMSNGNPVAAAPGILSALRDYPSTRPKALWVIFDFMTVNFSTLERPENILSLIEELSYLSDRFSFDLTMALSRYVCGLSSFTSAKSDMDKLVNFHLFTCALWDHGLLYNDNDVFFFMNAMAGGLEVERPAREVPYWLDIIEIWLQKNGYKLRERVRRQRTTNDRYLAGDLYSKDEKQCELKPCRWNFWCDRRMKLARTKGSEKHVKEAERMRKIPFPKAATIATVAIKANTPFTDHPPHEPGVL